MKLFNWFTKKTSQKTKVHSKPEPEKDDGYEKVILTKGVFKASRNKVVPETDKFHIKNIYITDRTYFKKNQVIAVLASAIHGSGLIFIQLPFSGKMEKILIRPNHKISFNDKLFSVTRIANEATVNKKIIEQNKTTLDQTEVGYLKDEFTDDKTIKVMRVGAEETPYFKLYEDQTESLYNFLGISLTNHNGYIYMSIHSRNEHITLAKGDSIIFLFQDKSRVSLTFKHAGNGTKGLRNNHAAIGYEELEAFLNKRLVKAKLISARKNLYSIYSLNHRIYENPYLSIEEKAQYSIEIEGQYLLKLLTARFIEMNQKYKIR